MLRGETDHRILAFAVKGLDGKTFLSRWAEGYCREQGISVVRIDFNPDVSDPVSYLKLLSILREETGGNDFKEVELCQKRYESVRSFINVVAGSGESRIEMGEKGKIEGSQASGWTGRDKFDISQNLFMGTDAEAWREEQKKHDFGQAMMRDLRALCEVNQLVLILDLVERAPVETRRWLEEWLFNFLETRYPKLHVILMSRPEWDALQQPRTWHNMMKLCDHFEPPDLDDIREFAQINGEQVEDSILQEWQRYASVEMGSLWWCLRWRRQSRRTMGDTLS